MVPPVINCRDGFQSSAPWVRKVHRNDASSLRRKGGAGCTMIATCSVQPGILPPRPLLGGRFKALVHCLGVLWSDSDFLILLAQFFMNESERIVARRQALDLVLPIFGG